MAEELKDLETALLSAFDDFVGALPEECERFELADFVDSFDFDRYCDDCTDQFLEKYGACCFFHACIKFLQDEDRCEIEEVVD